MSNEMQTRNVVLIGTPRCGKTTLMAAWYHFARETGYDPTPIEGDADAGAVVELADRLSEARTLAVDPTERGRIGRARFHCTHQVNEKTISFELVLCDYNGEDVREAFSRVQLGGTSITDEPIVDEVINRADRIVFVVQPQWLVGGQPGQQHEILLLLKHLKDLKDHCKPNQLLDRCRIYLSHADQATPQVRDQAERLIRQALDDSDIKQVDVIHGASVVKDRNGRIRFPEGGQGQPQTLINQAMTDFLSGAGATGRIPLKKFVAVVAAILLAALTLTAGSYLWTTNGEDRCGQAWTAHREALDDLEREADRNPTHARARTLEEELDRWLQTAETRFGDCLVAANLDPKLESLRNRLAEFGVAQDVDEVVAQVRQLRRRYGSDLRAFYEQLRTTARKERADRRYTRQAREEWSQLEKFSERILNGLTIKLGVSWLETPRFWTRWTGTGKLRAELWNTSRADPRPFDPQSRVSQSADVLWTDKVAPAGPSNDTYHVRWTRVGGTSRPLRIDDRLWLRIWHDRKWLKPDRELTHIEVPLEGPHLLGWFNRRQVIRIGSEEAACLIRVVVDPPLQIPVSLREAF